VLARSSVNWNRGFTGYISDSETGMLHARGRQYVPTMGRFASRDGRGYVNGMGLYVGYFSPNFLDPSGLAVEDFYGEIILNFMGRRAAVAADRLPSLVKMFMGTVAHRVIERAWGWTGARGEASYPDHPLSDHLDFWGVRSRNADRPDMGDAIPSESGCGEHLLYEIKPANERGYAAAISELEGYKRAFNREASGHGVVGVSGDSWPRSTMSLPVLTLPNGDSVEVEFWSAGRGVVLYRYVMEVGLRRRRAAEAPAESLPVSPAAAIAQQGHVYDPSTIRNLDWYFVAGIYATVAAPFVAAWGAAAAGGAGAEAIAGESAFAAGANLAAAAGIAGAMVGQ